MAERFAVRRRIYITAAFVAGLMLGAFIVELKTDMPFFTGEASFVLIARCLSTGP